MIISTEARPLTVKEAAERLGISKGLVYLLIRAGKIRSERHGTGRGVIRITESAFEEYRTGAVQQKEENRPAITERATGGRSFKNLDSTRLAEAWKGRRD